MSVWDNPYISKRGRFSDSVSPSGKVASSKFLEHVIGGFDYARKQLVPKHIRRKYRQSDDGESEARSEERNDS